MPRKIVPPSNEFPYHISARVRNREDFPMEKSEVWSLMEDYLAFISHAYGIEILSFVLMDNHFHMLVRDPLLQLSSAMNYFMKETSRHLGASAHVINQIYGGRYHRSLIMDPLYLLHAYKYVYRNPVEAGLCERVEDYPYSSLYRILGKERLNFPIYPDQTLFESPDMTLRWLNTSPTAIDKELVRKNLRKSVFNIRPSKNIQRTTKLQTELY